jgi:hypothetical protein
MKAMASPLPGGLWGSTASLLNWIGRRRSPFYKIGNAPKMNRLTLAAWLKAQRCPEACGFLRLPWSDVAL